MNLTEYQLGLKRLNDAFNGFYNKERSKAIWQEVQKISYASWMDFVNTSVLNLRFAPTVKEIIDLVISVREKVYGKQKETWRTDANDFWAGTYHTDEIKIIVGTIKKRMAGQVIDSDWESFVSTLKNKADEAALRMQCKKCEDIGLRFKTDKNGYNFVYKCDCRMGSAQNKNYPTFPVDHSQVTQ